MKPRPAGRRSRTGYSLPGGGANRISCRVRDGAAAAAAQDAVADDAAAADVGDDGDLRARRGCGAAGRDLGIHAGDEGAGAAQDDAHPAMQGDDLGRGFGGVDVAGRRSGLRCALISVSTPIRRSFGRQAGTAVLLQRFGKIIVRFRAEPPTPHRPLAARPGADAARHRLLKKTRRLIGRESQFVHAAIRRQKRARRQ